MVATVSRMVNAVPRPHGLSLDVLDILDILRHSTLPKWTGVVFSEVQSTEVYRSLPEHDCAITEHYGKSEQKSLLWQIGVD
jgi:hypothetical protein